MWRRTVQLSEIVQRRNLPNRKAALARRKPGVHPSSASRRCADSAAEPECAGRQTGRQRPKAGATAIRLQSQQDNARSHTAPRRARSVKSRQLDGCSEAGQAMRQTPADNRTAETCSEYDVRGRRRRPGPRVRSRQGIVIAPAQVCAASSPRLAVVSSRIPGGLRRSIHHELSGPMGGQGLRGQANSPWAHFVTATPGHFRRPLHWFTA